MFIKFALTSQHITYVCADGLSSDINFRYTKQNVLGVDLTVAAYPNMTEDKKNPYHLMWNGQAPVIVNPSGQALNSNVLGAGIIDTSNPDQHCLYITFDAIANDAFRRGDPGRSPAETNNIGILQQIITANFYQVSYSYTLPTYFWVTYGVPCDFSVNTNVSDFGPSGGNATATVSSVPNDPSCKWQAVASTNWIKNVFPTNGAGSGLVTFNIAPYNDVTGIDLPIRNGSINIAGENINITQHVGCGDVRDKIIKEYEDYLVFDITNSSLPFVPTCNEFTSSAGSKLFKWPALNKGDYPGWALIRRPLVDPASTHHGFDAWIAEIRKLGDKKTRPINSAYRNPARNARVKGKPGSRHMFGDAVDLANLSKGTKKAYAEYKLLVAAAKNAGQSWIEDFYGKTGPCRDACVHVDWRNTSGDFAP